MSPRVTSTGSYANDDLGNDYHDCSSTDDDPSSDVFVDRDNDKQSSQHDVEDNVSGTTEPVTNDEAEADDHDVNVDDKDNMTKITILTTR